MDEFVGGSGFLDAQTFGQKPSEAGSVFDASQYAFFGNDAVEEVELGGLEDEEELPSVEFDDLDKGDQDQDFGLESFSEADDLANSFTTLNRVASGPAGIPGITNDRVSREGSSAAEWAKEMNNSSWYDRHLYDAEYVPEGKDWSSQPSQLDPKPLFRTSSYSEPQPQQQHQHFSTEPIPMAKSSFPSYPPPGDMPLNASPNNHFHHPNAPYITGRPQIPFSQSMSNLPGPPFGLSHNAHVGNTTQFSAGLSVNDHPPGQWSNQTNMYHGDHANLSKNILSQQLPRHNGLMPQLMSQQQQQQHHRLHHPVHPHFDHVSGMHPHMHMPHLSGSPSVMNRFDGLGIPHMMEQRPNLMQRNRQYPQRGFSNSSLRGESIWSQFRSKYMTAEEIENIIKMQLAATLSNDPYVEDYYHQACLAKKSSGARLRRHFCPNLLKEFAPRVRPSDEPHAFLQVEALGRIPFSSVRRPRPLLEMEPPNSSGSCVEQKVVKLLEQEPMLAARVTIEDCLCLLLDIDDMDRFLQFNELPDGGIELRRRRQSQMECLAASFQLVDPLGKDGQTVRLAPKDDFVFLSIVSLPKGRKLLLRYLEKLSPGDELLRTVSMAIFRHLRFLFGNPPSDPAIFETTTSLAKVMSSHVHDMDLNTLSACLAAVVCSSEQPPLRPIGSSAGDGASIVLKSVLERATDLLKDSHALSNYNMMPNRAFWQASFDEFFVLLTKYCISKYDSIVQPLVMQASPATEPDVARAIRKEMPIELLRASLPHTNEKQKKLLMDFAQRTVQ